MIRQVDEELYAELCKWWEYYGTPKVQFEILKRSFVAFVGERPVCFAFCLVDDMKFFAWLIYITMNPEAKTNERDKGFKEMMEAITKALKEEGISFVYAPANNPSLLIRLRENGFSIADLDVTDMCKNLKEEVCHNYF